MATLSTRNSHNKVNKLWSLCFCFLDYPWENWVRLWDLQKDRWREKVHQRQSLREASRAAEPLSNINSDRGFNVSFHLENKTYCPLKEEEKIHAPYKVSLTKSDPQPKKHKTCKKTEKCNLSSREKVMSSQWKFLNRRKKTRVVPFRRTTQGASDLGSIEKGLA